jgi:tRNA A-37 threonylcarbamoyl transferase component Bud32/tetratricopeptide (TPR) repeat protein
MGAAQTYADQAVKAADAAPTPNPTKLMAALDQRGIVEFKTGNYQQAMADAQRVLALSPTDQKALSIYHDAKSQLDAQSVDANAGKAAKGLADGMAAPDLNPGGLKATKNSDGRSMPSTNEDPRLKATAQNVAALAHLKDAKRLLDMGDGEGALRAAEAAGAASPAFAADALVMRAQAWAVLKDLDKALAQISEAIKLLEAQGRKGDAARAYSQRAAFQNDLARPGDAVADADRALENDPKLASAFYERARADEAGGDADKAAADMDQAALLDPGFMADRDDFHKRHRAAVAAGDGSPGIGAALAERLKSVGTLKAGGALAGILLIVLALGVARFAGQDSPVGRMTWSRAQRAARAEERESDGPRELNDQYRIVKKIGEGGMGTVFEGFDKDLKRRVAIKRLRPELQGNARERARFIQEAELVASLQHPHTVQIFTILRDELDTHIVFEYIEGGTLHDALNAAPGRHLEPRRALELLRQVAEAVDHAHERRVIHRDLKPANVMIDERGWAKVMDFGIARQVADALGKTATNTIVGTPVYMAPEQHRGDVRRESDVYALGVTLYEMLTGALPFTGPQDLDDKMNGRFLPPSQVRAGLPVALDAVLAKALSPRPEDRFHTCVELCRAAEGALGLMTPT